MPTTLYDALIEHAAPADFRVMGDHAKKRGLTRYAVKLYRAAVAHGDTTALLPLTWLLKEANQIDEALACCKRAVDASNGRDGTETLGGLLERVGRREEALAAYQKAAAYGSVYAAIQVIRLLTQAGRGEDAIAWLETHVDAGDRFAPMKLAELYEQAGREKRWPAIGARRNPVTPTP